MPAFSLFSAASEVLVTVWLLSMLGYLALVVLGVIAWQQQRRGRFFFRLHPGVTWSFLVLWMVSVLSGEGIFIARYVR